jgi:hypothetical protein
MGTRDQRKTPAEGEAPGESQETACEAEEVIPRELIEWYCERSGDTGIGDPTVNWEWAYHEDHGFITYVLLGGKFWILNCCGDGAFWDSWAMEKAREEGCSVIAFLTKRNPWGFMRKYDYDLTGYLLTKEVATKH